MINQIILFCRFIKILGLINGSFTFFRIQTGAMNAIKIKDILYPIILRKKTSDINTFIQIFINQEYNIKLDFEPKVIVDCGANVGLFSIIMKNRFQDSKIICIEPDVENFSVLKKNLSFYNNIFCENVGLWSRTIKLKISDKYNFGKWGMVVEEDPDNGGLTALTIDDIIAKYEIQKIDILKIDIETSEKKIFSENYKNWLPKTKLIIIELHDWLESGCSKPFFNALTECINDYTYLIVGENTVIVNNDIIL